MRKKSAPATAAALHCGAVGFSSPRSRAHDPRMPPAATERTPAIRNGGIDSTPKRIARKVEPQMIQVAAYAAEQLRPLAVGSRHRLAQLLTRAGALARRRGR